LVDLRGLTAYSDLRDVFDVVGRAVGLPHLPVEEPGDLAGGNGGVIVGEFWDCIVPWPAEAALARRLSICLILSHTEVSALYSTFCSLNIAGSNLFYGPVAGTRDIVRALGLIDEVWSSN
jgi:hypothetical protein